MPPPVSPEAFYARLTALATAPAAAPADQLPRLRQLLEQVLRAECQRRAAPFADRAAWFTCALVLAWPDSHVEGFEGKVRGQWVWPPRGSSGFGYDPLFVPEGQAQTFGEMDPAEKHRISHRARAFALLAAACLPPAGS